MVVFQACLDPQHRLGENQSVDAIRFHYKVAHGLLSDCFDSLSTTSASETMVVSSASSWSSILWQMNPLSMIHDHDINSSA